MHVLSREKRLAVLGALVDGNSLRATADISGTHQDTVASFLRFAGTRAQWIHDRLVRDLSCSRIAVDEIFGFVKRHPYRHATDPADPTQEGVGHAWVYAGLDVSSRMIVSFHVGPRDMENTKAFITDLRSRLVVMPELIVSDGLRSYESPIDEHFKGCAYVQTIKNTRKRGAARTQNPGPFLVKRAVGGIVTPQLIDEASTALLERNHLTIRHKNGRLRRKCMAYSRTIESHRAAVALTYVWYNIGHIVRTLKVTPAIAAGVLQHVVSLDEFLEMILREPEGARPVIKPMTPRQPTTTARQLPGGGWLQVVPPGTRSGTRPRAPAPSPPPKPRAPVQLGLFNIDIEPPPAG